MDFDAASLCDSLTTVTAVTYDSNCKLSRSQKKLLRSTFENMCSVDMGRAWLLKIFRKDRRIREFFEFGSASNERFVAHAKAVEDVFRLCVRDLDYLEPPTFQAHVQHRLTALGRQHIAVDPEGLIMEFWFDFELTFVSLVSDMFAGNRRGKRIILAWTHLLGWIINCMMHGYTSSRKRLDFVPLLGHTARRLSQASNCSRSVGSTCRNKLQES